MSLRRETFPIVALSILIFGMSACGTESITTSCNTISSNSKCSQSEDISATVDVSRDLCENPIAGDAGTFATSACPSSNRVGICDQTDADNDIHFYSTGGAPFDATTAEAACDGTFSS